MHGIINEGFLDLDFDFGIGYEFIYTNGYKLFNEFD